MEHLAEVVVVVAMLAAVFFTVVPLLPGTLFVLAGALAFGAIEGFEPFHWWFWVVQVGLAIAYIAVDNVAQLFGVQRAGGSPKAMWGGTIGVFVGPLAMAPVLGPFALFVGPPVGAVAGSVLGEVLHRRGADTPSEPAGSLRGIGWGAAFAYLIGMVAKLAVLTVQLVLLGMVVF